MISLTAEMDLVSAAMDAMQPDAAKAPARESLALARCLRGKIAGLLLRKARLAADIPLDDCAAFLQVAPSTVDAWECGEESVSLPQLELLSGYLSGERTPSRHSQYLLLRQRIIGAQMRMARESMRLDLDSLAAATGFAPNTLVACEMGEVAVSLGDLSGLAQALDMDMRALLEAPQSQVQSAAPLEPAQNGGSPPADAAGRRQGRSLHATGDGIPRDKASRPPAHCRRPDCNHPRQRRPAPSRHLSPARCPAAR